MRNKQRIIDAFEEYFEEYGPKGSLHQRIHPLFQGYAMVKHLQIRKQTN